MNLRLNITISGALGLAWEMSYFWPPWWELLFDKAMLKLFAYDLPRQHVRL